MTALPFSPLTIQGMRDLRSELTTEVVTLVNCIDAFPCVDVLADANRKARLWKDLLDASMARHDADGFQRSARGSVTA